MDRITVEQCDVKLNEISQKIKASAEKIDGLLELQREWERLRNEAMARDMYEEAADAIGFSDHAAAN